MRGAVLLEFSGRQVDYSALQAPLAGSAVIQPFGARLARAAAAAEGGAKLKMADKTPGGSQKASSKVL